MCDNYKNQRRKYFSCDIIESISNNILNNKNFNVDYFCSNNAETLIKAGNLILRELNKKQKSDSGESDE